MKNELSLSFSSNTLVRWNVEWTDDYGSSALLSLSSRVTRDPSGSLKLSTFAGLDGGGVCTNMAHPSAVSQEIEERVCPLCLNCWWPQLKFYHQNVKQIPNGIKESKDAITKCVRPFIEFIPLRISSFFFARFIYLFIYLVRHWP
jgi:hypothetical protein